jgi:hypothetical protein
MDEGEINRQLRELVEQLKHENELLRAKVIELEARLAQYENAHTPSSLRRGRNRKKDQDKKNNGKPGQKIGQYVNAGQEVHRSGGMKVLRSINTCLLLFHYV